MRLGESKGTVLVARGNVHDVCADCNFFRSAEDLKAQPGGMMEVPCSLATALDDPKATIPKYRALLAEVDNLCGQDCTGVSLVNRELGESVLTEIVLSGDTADALEDHLGRQIGCGNPGYFVGDYETSEGVTYVFAGLVPKLIEANGGTVVRLGTKASNGVHAIFNFNGPDVARVSSTNGPDGFASLATGEGFHWENPSFTA